MYEMKRSFHKSGLKKKYITPPFLLQNNLTFKIKGQLLNRKTLKVKMLINMKLSSFFK